MQIDTNLKPSKTPVGQLEPGECFIKDNGTIAMVTQPWSGLVTILSGQQTVDAASEIFMTNLETGDMMRMTKNTMVIPLDAMVSSADQSENPGE